MLASVLQAASKKRAAWQRRAPTAAWRACKSAPRLLAASVYEAASKFLGGARLRSKQADQAASRFKNYT